MKFEKVLDQAVSEGAIRIIQLSENMAFVYRLKDGAYQARGLYRVEEDWRIGDFLVSGKQFNSPDGWYKVGGLPWTAKPIAVDAAQENPGYAQKLTRQCYTCKKTKPEEEFERPYRGSQLNRDWECNECYSRRLRDLANFRKQGETRTGDYLDKDTLASPPPPKGQI
jgi:hypothetical protein